MLMATKIFEENYCLKLDTYVLSKNNIDKSRATFIKTLTGFFKIYFK